jgi:hypothetical protein
MSDYLDRLERELLSAGRRYQARSAPPSVRRSRLPRLRASVAVIASLAVTIGVVAVILGAGLIHGGSSSTTGHHAQQTPTTLPGPTGTKVTAVGACRRRGGLPPLVMSNAAPGPELADILSIARDPAGDGGATTIRGFDRYPLGVLTVFRRFIRIVSAERGVRVAFFPVVFCQQTPSGRGFPPPRIRIAPAQAIVMLPLQGKTLAVEASTPSVILDGSALPGLDRLNNGGWIQSVIVPDGVAKVVMQFTPPFLHHYTVTATIHDNVAVVVRNPDYTPTIVRWYAANGHLLHTYVDWPALHYQNCLAHHRKTCTG